MTMKIFYGIVSLILAFGIAYGTYVLFIHLKLFINQPLIATNHRVLPREAGQHESWLLYD